MKKLRIALVVPVYGLKGADGEHKKELLKEKCHSGQIDLIVYPEYFGGRYTFNNAVDNIRTYAEEFKTPVLSGCSILGEVIDKNFIAAVYVNPDPMPGETDNHLYLKHSSADRLAYQWPGYAGNDDPMFKPVKLGGFKFGVMICHDQFFGLVTARCADLGAQGLFDLTGDNVQLKKWTDVIQGRSIEINGPFFCTMASNLTTLKPKSKAKAKAMAYDNGVELMPMSYARPDGTGGFHIFEWTTERPGGPIIVHQGYSPKKYNDIRLSLGRDRNCDISIHYADGKLTLSGRKPLQKVGKWHGFEVSGRAGVLSLPVEDIYRTRKLYKLRPPSGSFAHHIVVYHKQKTPVDQDRILAMAKLRAIEHRVAVVILAGDMREVIKTDRYKHIQRIQAQNNIFGLNASNMGGTYSTYRSAIPPELFDNYLELA